MVELTIKADGFSKMKGFMWEFGAKKTEMGYWAMEELKTNKSRHATDFETSLHLQEHSNI